MSLAANMTTTPTTTPALANDTRLKDFEKFVKDCAEDEAAGKDALPNFSIGFVRAVYEGVIDPAKDANGDDAAARYFKKYSAMRGKKAYHDRTETSQKAQVSKLRQMQNAAANPKFDFVDVLNRAITIRQQAIKDDIDVKSPYPAYVDVAREQLKQDDELDDAQIFAAVTTSDKTKEVTLEGQLKKAAKILEDIISGEKHPGVHDNSPEVHIASEQLVQRIKAIELKQVQDEALTKALAAGYVVNADGTLSLPQG
jgi:hypothetical protein